MLIVVVFLLGRPGSGKSSVACDIKRMADRKHWATRHFFDYQLLQEMFLEEEREHGDGQGKNFRRRGLEEYNGFDVLNFKVLDTVLGMMAKRIRAEKESQELLERNTLFLVEFARDNYAQALYRFGPDILQDAHLLYLDTNLETCIERVHSRIDNPTIECGQYNHFVSDNIMRGYYCRDDWEEVPFSFPLDRSIQVHPLKVENNVDDRQVLTSQIEKWVDDVHLFSDRTLVKA